jgi:CheY-like chemotaxis protein
METIAGRKILVVEDEWLIADNMSSMLEDMECLVVGPVATVAKALEVISTGGIDCVLLDANLNGVSSAPIADELTGIGIPFIMVTGYGGQKLPTDTMNSAHRLGKPFFEYELRASLELTFVQLSSN